VIVPAAWILATVRLWALLRVQAGWRAALGPVWEAVALVLAFVLAAPVSQAGAVATLSWGTLAAEAALGTCLGLGLSLGGRAVVGAARWQADAFGVPPRAWTRLGAALAGVAAVGGGLHHAALAGLGHVVELWPLGRPDLWGMGDLSVLALLDGARALLVLGLALATPVVLVAATAQLALGALAGRRGGLWVAEPLVLAVRALGGLVALAAAWSLEPRSWGDALTRWIGAPS